GFIVDGIGQLSCLILPHKRMALSQNASGGIVLGGRPLRRPQLQARPEPRPPSFEAHVCHAEADVSNRHTRLRHMRNRTYRFRWAPKPRQIIIEIRLWAVAPRSDRVARV